MRVVLCAMLVIVAIVCVNVDSWAVSVRPEEVKCRLKGDPLLFGAASFFVPGLGQFFNGQDGKGITHLVVAIILPAAVAYLAYIIVPISPLAFAVPSLIYLAWALYSALDAYNIAAEYCKA